MKEKVVLITGANSGIGFASAHALEKLGTALSWCAEARNGCGRET